MLRICPLLDRADRPSVREFLWEMFRLAHECGPVHALQRCQQTCQVFAVANLYSRRVDLACKFEVALPDDALPHRPRAVHPQYTHSIAVAGQD